MLRWSDEIREYIVPRLEDHLIDDLFYQEDEIGEMRHTAFMIECGLEEDPPDGPDVPPIPWGEELLKQQNQQQKTSAKSNGRNGSSPTSILPEEPLSLSARALPDRARSADDVGSLVDDSSPKRTPPSRRKLVATKSGSLHAMRPTKDARRSPPGKSHSSDEIKLPDAHLNLSFAKTEPKSPARRAGRRLVATKSGSLHGMQAAAKQAAEQDEKECEPSPSRARKMTRCKSGTAHGMRKAAEAAMALSKAKDDTDEVNTTDSNSTATSLEASASEASPRRLRKMTRCKSGTSHGMRKAAEAAVALSQSPDRPPRPAVRRGTTRAAALSESTSQNSAGTSTESDTSSASPSKQDTHIVFKNGKRTVVSKSRKEDNENSASKRSGVDIPPRPSPRRNSNDSLPRGISPRSSFGTSSSSSSLGEDDFLSELGSDTADDNSVDVSISTDASNDDDEPVFSSPSKGLSKSKIRYQSSQKKDKDKKKLETTKSSKTKMKTTKDTDTKISESPSLLKRSWPPKPKASPVYNVSSTRPTSSTVDSAISRLRNGKSSPSELLASMQQRDTGRPGLPPSKSTTTTTTSTTAKSPSPRSRPVNITGNVKKFKSKSVGNLDIPPAFRNL
jgi:hypothetical protein